MSAETSQDKSCPGYVTRQLHLRSTGIRRVETGPVAFGNDWPGVFIRGDDAFGYAGFLGATARALEHLGEDAGSLGPEALAQALKSIQTLLLSCVPAELRVPPQGGDAQTINTKDEENE